VSCAGAADASRALASKPKMTDRMNIDVSVSLG
jgi:hypothetical protein